MTKARREQLFNKYGGKCAYCGCELQKGWHVDHLEPVRRGFDFNNKPANSHPERDCIENMMPACASCNINKHSMSLEQFRGSIKQFVQSLNLYSTQYKIAKRYGLIIETNIEVKFYFETIFVQDSAETKS